MQPADPATVARVVARVAEIGPYFAVDDARSSLTEMVHEHARRLGTAELRVAGSILFQGLAARRWSPVLGCAVEGLLLDGSARGWLLTETDDRAALVAETVVERQLRPLVAALRGVVRISEGLLWGNAASALMGTVLVTELAGRDGDGDARALAGELLQRPPLRGAADPGPPFRRRSCCLYYRVPGGGLCGDCSLNSVPTGR